MSTALCVCASPLCHNDTGIGSGRFASNLAMCPGGGALAEDIAVSERVQVSLPARLAARDVASWPGAYRRQAVIVDACCALGAGWLAFEARFGSASNGTSAYFWLGLALPALWLVALELAGASDSRFVGVGPDEFRRVLNAGVCLTAIVAIFSYATKADLARGYVVVALPCMTVFNLLGRYMLRKTAAPAALAGLVHAQGGSRRTCRRDRRPGGSAPARDLSRAIDRGRLRRRSQSADLYRRDPRDRRAARRRGRGQAFPGRHRGGPGLPGDDR